MNWSYEMPSRCHIARKRSASASTSACGAMPCCVGGLLDLLSVLVHADEEVHVVAAQAAISRDGVGADLLVRVTDVRIAVRVVDRGREVVRGH